MIVWWGSCQLENHVLADRGDDRVLRKMNGKRYPQPALLFKACGTHLWVRALDRHARPKAETRMCMAPFWNCYDNGVVCTGSMKIPREKTVAAIDVWGELIFRERVYSRLRGSRTRAISRRPLGDVAVPRRKKRIPQEVPGEVATDTRRIRERP